MHAWFKWIGKWYTSKYCIKGWLSQQIQQISPVVSVESNCNLREWIEALSLIKNLHDPLSIYTTKHTRI